MFVNDEEIETVTALNNIVSFTARTFTANDVIRVEGATTSDTFTIAETVNNNE